MNRVTSSGTIVAYGKKRFEPYFINNQYIYDQFHPNSAFDDDSRNLRTEDLPYRSQHVIIHKER